MTSCGGFGSRNRAELSATGTLEMTYSSASSDYSAPTLRAQLGTFSKGLTTARHWAAVATAFTLPWSTSGQAITGGLFVLLALLTIHRDAWLATLCRPAAALPTLLFLLLLGGMMWSPEPLGAGGITHYAKLLLIPVVMAAAITPREALQIGYAFLAGCLIVLVLSWGSLLWPAGPWAWFKAPGVPVKDNAVQSGCFALCALGLGIAAAREWSLGERKRAAAMTALALLFFADIFLIYVSKTGMLEAVALLGLFLVWLGGWRRAVLIAGGAALTIFMALSASVPAQHRLAEFVSDMQADSISQESVSTASRHDFWNKAIDFVEEAPLFGHGTGSTKSLFQALQATHPSPYGEAVPDPHNQFLAIAIQVGLVGGALLVAMWLAHFLVFAGRDAAALLGQAVVLQNFIGSLFNSHLSTITQGTLYCLAVGLLGALVCRTREPGYLEGHSPAGLDGTGWPSGILDSAHFLVRCLRYRFRTEKLQIKTMMQLRLGGATVLDIGANKGIYCFWMMRAVGTSGRVIAFEPQPEMRDAIERLKRRFGWPNLGVLNVGLSDLAGRRRLSRQKIGDGSATLEQSRHRRENKTLAVVVTRMDDLPADMLCNLKFIKCDVEGHERNVFLGGEQTIRRHRPVVQFESTVGDENTQEIFRFFRALGYSGVMLLGDQYLHYSNPDQVPHYKFGLSGHRDFLFFPPEAVGTTIPTELFRSFAQDSHSQHPVNDEAGQIEAA
jgi:O-antigen ligase